MIETSSMVRRCKGGSFRKVILDRNEEALAAWALPGHCRLRQHSQLPYALSTITRRLRASSPPRASVTFLGAPFRRRPIAAAWMPRHVVFLGAPTRSQVLLPTAPHDGFAWTTLRLVSPTPTPSSVDILPPATLDEASTRLTDLYKGVVFKDDEEEEGSGENPHILVDEETIERTEITEVTETSAAPTDVHTTILHSRVSLLRTRHSTTQSLLTDSLPSSHASSDRSIARFPTFHINLHTLTSLTSLASLPPSHLPRKVNILVAVLEVEGPDTVTLKRGRDAGSEAALLKLVVGDEDSRMARVTVWRASATSWSIVRKGDTVLLESLSPSPPSSPPGPVALTASPGLQSKMTICYRSLPQMPEDRRYRPDLRIGETDPGVRKVGRVKEWVERMAGIT